MIFDDFYLGFLIMLFSGDDSSRDDVLGLIEEYDFLGRYLKKSRCYAS